MFHDELKLTTLNDTVTASICPGRTYVLIMFHDELKLTTLNDTVTASICPGRTYFPNVTLKNSIFHFYYLIFFFLISI